MKKLIDCLAIIFFVAATSTMSFAYVKYQLSERQNTAPVATNQELPK
jgi:hypothetical protein